MDGDEKIATKEKVERWLKAKLPDPENIPANSWNLALQCFASVCYHHGYLSKHLDANCSFRHTSVFRNLPEEFEKLATVKYPWDKTADTPKFNGIPPHVLHLVQIESLERKIENLEENLMARFVSEMDQRGFSSTAFKTSDITDAISSLAEKIMTEMKELKDDLKSCRSAPADYVIDDSAGVVIPGGTAMVDEDDFFGNAHEAEGKEEDEPRESEQRRLQRKRKERETSDGLVKKRPYRVGQHHGRLNILPPDYKFPPMGPLQLCENWLLGSERQNIPPLCMLGSKDVMHLKSGNKQRNKMASIMRVVERMAREKNVWIEKTCDWDDVKVMNMWDAIGPEFERLYCQTKRKTQIKISTVFQRMTDANAFGNPSNKKEIEKRQQQQAALQGAVVYIFHYYSLKLIEFLLSSPTCQVRERCVE